MKFQLFRKANTGSGILFFVFFFMMIMIAGGLVGGAYAFFGKGYDFRAIESRQLFTNMKDCFLQNNFFDKGFTENNLLFFEICDLSKEVLEDGHHLVYVRKISDNKEFFVGVYDFKVRCGLDSRFKNREFPLCKSETLGDYELIVGSSQNVRRVSI